MLPSATDLSYFLAVAETLNIRRAAERLRIAQPSLSIAIRRLEDTLGAPLLVRYKSGVRLTRAGERFVANARTLLNDWEKLRSEAARDEVEVRGRYVIGCPLDMGLGILPGVLPKLLHSHSALEIELVHDVSQRITEDVVGFKVDFGLVANPLKHPDLIIRRICSDEIRMWVSDCTPPAQDPQSGQAVLVYDPAVFGRIGTKSVGNISFAHIITTTSLHMVARLVAVGVGIGALPGRVAALLGAAGIHPLGRDLLYIPHDICFIYRSDAQRSPAGRRLAREFEAALRETTGSRGRKATA